MSCPAAAGPSAAVTSGQIWEIVVFPSTAPDTDAPLRSRRCQVQLREDVAEDSVSRGVTEGLLLESNHEASIIKTERALRVQDKGQANVFGVVASGQWDVLGG